MWVFRKHNIESPFIPSYDTVKDIYIKKINDGVLPTELEIEELLDKLMPRRSEEATFSFEVEENVVRATVVQDSMEEYYKNMKRGPSVQVIGTRTRKRIRCVICMSSKHTKIKLPCGHIFHRKCIDEWACWKSVCPTCETKLTLASN